RTTPTDAPSPTSPSPTTGPWSSCSMRSRWTERDRPPRTVDVVHPDVAAELKDLSTTLESIEAVTDLPALRAEIAELSEQAGRPDLWNDTEAAQKVTSRLA